MHHASYPVSVRRPASFALDFLPTPPHDDAVVLWLTFGSADTWYRDSHPAGFVPCTAHTFELSGGEAVRLNEGLGVTDGGKARYGLNATGLAAARLGAAKAAPTFTERQRPQTD